MVDHDAAANKEKLEKPVNKRWITANLMHNHPTGYPQRAVDRVHFIFQIIGL
tara:strand:- start:94 stop:249 length:156 start_codon:yes stop_codon:yes gene_type:complete